MLSATKVFGNSKSLLSAANIGIWNSESLTVMSAQISRTKVWDTKNGKGADELLGTKTGTHFSPII